MRNRGAWGELGAKHTGSDLGEIHAKTAQCEGLIPGLGGSPTLVVEEVTQTLHALVAADSVVCAGAVGRRQQA